MLRTDLVDELEGDSLIKRLLPTARRTLELKRDADLSWRQILADGRSMKRGSGRTWSQMMLAANTPQMLKAGLVEGDTHAGVLACGQVVGLLDDLPTCEELIDRVVAEAVARSRSTSPA
jgi:NAD(P)H-dependent flavin oxidoreductase YrpB (nitropropane dioxygenase family)